MLESQFFSCITLIAVFGVIFILSMFKKGKKNSIENPPEKHTALKVLSGVFLVLALFSLAAGILTITEVQFPTVMGKQPVTPHSIIRSSSATLYWGYPTSTQNMALMHISSVFASLAFAAYFAVFRKSGSNGWKKFLKVVGIVLMYVFFASATDLHYFDMYELFAPISFLILALIGIFGGKKAVVEEFVTEVPAQTAEFEKVNDTRNKPLDEPLSDTSNTTIETIDVEL